VDPVEITILPAGKSLDVCAEIREKKKQGESDSSIKRRKRRSKKTAKVDATDNEPKTDMFDFLNTRIFKKGDWDYICLHKIIMMCVLCLEKAPSQLETAKEKYGSSSTMSKKSDNIRVKASTVHIYFNIHQI